MRAGRGSRDPGKAARHSQRLVCGKLHGREAQRLVAALHPEKDRFLLPVHFHSNHHTGAYRFRHRDLVRLDVAPVAVVAPIYFKAAVGVGGILLRVLLPVRVVVPNAKGLGQIVGLERREELIDAVLLWPVPEVPEEAC